MNSNFEAGGHHAQGIVNPSLVVEDEFLRQQMHDLAIVGQGNSAGLVNRQADFIASNFTRPSAEADASVAVNATHMRAGDSHPSVLNRCASDVLGLLDGPLN